MDLWAIVKSLIRDFNLRVKGFRVLRATIDPEEPVL